LNAWGAFSRDGKLLALGDEPGVVRLIMPDTGVELARLTALVQTRLMPCCFTPDNTQLITLGGETGELYIFDLRAIRAGLAELDLDWDAPPLPPTSRGAAETSFGASPLSIQFDLGNIRQWPEAKKLLDQADHHVRAKEHARALADYSKSLDLNPQNLRTLNNLAWLLATCPDLKLRDPKRAVELAKEAVEMAPKDGMCWNTLGAASYRAGDWKAAVAALEKSMELRQGGDSFDWFFFAMAQFQLGEKDTARQWYDKAVVCMEKNQSKNEELARFRAEAEEMLGVKEEKN
jgi:tetratricopeptide (TPR) repeat protein